MQASPTNLPCSPLISQEEWHRLFPREDPDILREPHFLIANEDSEENIIESLRLLKDENSSPIHTALSEYQFTPLQIAVMKGYLRVVSALIEAGASVKKRDAYGWKPIHHAALVSNEMILMLLQKGAKAKSKTLLGGSFTLLRLMAGLQFSTKTYQNLSFRTSDRVVKKINIEKFKALTGLHIYTDQPYFPPKKIKDLWTASPKQTCSVDQIVENFQKEIYRKMIKNPPSLFVGEDRTFTAKLGQTVSKVYGLFANENLYFTQGIIEYSGQICEDEQTGLFKDLLSNEKFSQYRLVNLDAKSVGNAARFANEGWPNATTYGVSNEEGLPVRAFLSVIDPDGIKKGQDIRWDYGVGEVKLKWNSCYVIGGLADMHRFFKGRSFLDACDVHNKLHDSILENLQKDLPIECKEWYQKASIEARIKYIYSTPTTLIDLVCNKLIKIDKLKLLLNGNFLNIFRQKSLVHMMWIEQLISLLEEFENNLAKLSTINQTGPAIEQDTRRFIVSLQGKITTIQVIQGIKEINEAFKKEPLESASLERWKVLKRHLIESLPSYKDYPFEVTSAIIFDSENFLALLQMIQK